MDTEKALEIFWKNVFPALYKEDDAAFRRLMRLLDWKKISLKGVRDQSIKDVCYFFAYQIIELSNDSILIYVEAKNPDYVKCLPILHKVLRFLEKLTEKTNLSSIRDKKESIENMKKRIEREIAGIDAQKEVDEVIALGRINERSREIEQKLKRTYGLPKYFLKR